MNRRAYNRRQWRILLTGCAGVALCAGALFLPWQFAAAAFPAIFLGGFAIFLGSAAAGGFAAWKFNRDTMYREQNDRQTEHERTLRAIAYVDSVEALKNDALRQGAALFGADAALRVVRVDGISTALPRKDRGAFTADVLVRAEPARETTDA